MGEHLPQRKAQEEVVLSIPGTPGFLPDDREIAQQAVDDPHLLRVERTRHNAEEGPAPAS